MKRDERLTVAITGMNAVADNPGAGLAVARCLREAYGERLRIIGLGYDALDPGLHRREYCDSAHLISYPGSGTDALFDRLAEIHEVERIDFLLPCLDAELPLLVNMAPRLDELGIRSYLPSREQLAKRTKDRLAELAHEAGTASPETLPVTHADFFRDCDRKGWPFPLVVKGVFYDARIAANREEAEVAFRAIAAEWGLPVLVQRRISGEECNLAGIGDGKGALLGEVMMKKRATTSRGKAWAGISIHDEELSSAAQRLVAALKWKGPIEIEVMRDNQGVYQLIEINPRFPAWIYLSQGVGRNLPAMLLALALGEEPLPLAPPRPGLLFIRYAQETLVPLSSFESLMVEGRSALESEQS
ncbi:MAG: ATP-grasp domain-containing protein [Betaproteobacteria bacterium]|nr:ATP-grasp domain-containing protein [Betaproteobacteria bacterium]